MLVFVFRLGHSLSVGLDLGHRQGEDFSVGLVMWRKGETLKRWIDFEALFAVWVILSRLLKVVERRWVGVERPVWTESCSVERCGVQTSMAVNGRRPCFGRWRSGYRAYAGGMEVFQTLSHGDVFRKDITAAAKANDRIPNTRASVKLFSTPNDDAISTYKCDLSLSGDCSGHAQPTLQRTAQNVKWFLSRCFIPCKAE